MGKGKFTLRQDLPGQVTIVRLNKAQGGGQVLLNRGGKRISAKGMPWDGLTPATQAEMRKVYDNGPEFATMIEAPKGYRAPWQELSDENAPAAEQTPSASEEE